MLVQNISPFRYSTFDAPCQITLVAGALYSEEGEKDFYLAWSTLLHQECKTCWLQEDNYKENTPQSQEHLCGFSWPVTRSAQMQSCSASPTQRHLLAEAHSPCAISNMPRKCPGLWARLELQKFLSQSLWDPKIFPLKFTEIFLSKHSACGLLLFCLLWRLIFRLPASVLSKNLQTIQKWKKTTVIIIQTKQQNSDFQAHLQHPCCSTRTLLSSRVFPKKSERQTTDVNQSRSLGQQQTPTCYLESNVCHRDKNIDFIAELSETMTFFFIPSLHDTNPKTNTLVESPLHFLIHCHLLSQSPAWETLAYTSLFM